MRPGATHFASRGAEHRKRTGLGQKAARLAAKIRRYQARRCDAHRQRGPSQKSNFRSTRARWPRSPPSRASVDQLRAELKPGFVPITEVFGFKSDSTGGIAAALDTSVPSITAGLLEAHGGELISWLEAHGFERKDADETDYESVQA